MAATDGAAGRSHPREHHARGLGPLRVARLVPTHWVLLDVQIHAIHNGFGHGLAHMFAEDGTLHVGGSVVPGEYRWARPLR